MGIGMARQSAETMLAGGAESPLFSNNTLQKNLQTRRAERAFWQLATYASAPMSLLFRGASCACHVYPASGKRGRAKRPHIIIMSVGENVGKGCAICPAGERGGKAQKRSPAQRRRAKRSLLCPLSLTTVPAAPLAERLSLDR